MRKPRRSKLARFVGVSAGLVVAPVLFASSLENFGDRLARLFVPERDLETITMTEVTAAGKRLSPPSPAKPLYYAGISAGYRDFGGIKAGEKPIPREKVNQTVLKALAKQGYLPAGPGQPPDVFLIWSWGSMNAKYFPGASPGGTPLNHHQMLRFMGGDRLGLLPKHGDPFPEHTLALGLFRGGDAENLHQVAMDDLYVAVVAAYSVDPASQRPELLWHTRISAPSRGFYLPEALPAMVAIATPYLGRDTPKPVWIHATDQFVPDIKLGDPRLIEYLESGEPAVVQVGAAK